MKTSAREELERAEKVLAEIERHPLTAKIREDEAATTLGKRKAAAARIEALEAERAEARPTLQAALDWAEAGYAAARDRLAEATEELRVTRYALQAEARDTDAAIGEQRAILYETAPPELDAAQEFFRSKLGDLRRPGRISYSKIGALRNIFTMTKTVTVASNEAAVLAALRYCQDAVAEIERMKLRPALDLSRIEALKAGVPRIDVYEEASGDKPLGK